MTKKGNCVQRAPDFRPPTSDLCSSLCPMHSNPRLVSFVINMTIVKFLHSFYKHTNYLGRKDAFSYITALVFVSVMGISLTAAGTYWSTIIKREKETELLFRGDQIRRAIESYCGGGPGGRGSQYPASLNDLLRDPRYPTLKKHLRKIYAF